MPNWWQWIIYIGYCRQRRFHVPYRINERARARPKKACWYHSSIAQYIYISHPSTLYSSTPTKSIIMMLIFSLCKIACASNRPTDSLVFAQFGKLLLTFATYFLCVLFVVVASTAVYCSASTTLPVSCLSQTWICIYSMTSIVWFHVYVIREYIFYFN